MGLLALQGDFALHQRALDRLGAAWKKVRLPADLAGLSGLILPGGESTAMAKLAQDSGLFDELRRAGKAGLPMFGTCAGAILLGKGDPVPPRLELVPVTVRRNAYGRQRESFQKRLPLRLAGGPAGAGTEHDCVFIRAPKLEVGPEPGVEILGSDDKDPVLMRYRNFLLSAFHPELTEDLAVHRLFLEMCRPPT